jgi:hypothetical protein
VTLGDEGYPLTFLVTPGELLYPAEALAAVPPLSSFFLILRSVEPEPFEGLDVLAGAALAPLSGLLTACGFADVPLVAPWDLPVSAGFRMARGLFADEDLPMLRMSGASPVPLLSFRSMTRFPSSGWTEIFVPAGLRLRFRLVRLILVRPLRESPRSALREMPGSLRWSLRMTVRARDWYG